MWLWLSLALKSTSPPRNCEFDITEYCCCAYLIHDKSMWLFLCRDSVTRVYYTLKNTVTGKLVDSRRVSSKTPALSEFATQLTLAVIQLPNGDTYTWFSDMDDLGEYSTGTQYRFHFMQFMRILLKYIPQNLLCRGVNVLLLWWKLRCPIWMPQNSNQLSREPFWQWIHPWVQFSMKLK